MFFQSTAIVILLLFYGCYYMKLKIAFLQLLPGAAIEDNIEKGIKACREAREKGADIALFPEMWSSGYVFPHDEEWLKKNSVSLDSAYVKRFSGLARELQMAIAITLLEKHEPNPRNTVCLFDRHGKLVYRYSKVHICNFGEEDDESVLDAGGWFDDLLRQGISRSSQGFDDERGGTSSCSKCLPDGNQPPVSAARTGL